MTDAGTTAPPRSESGEEAARRALLEAVAGGDLDRVRAAARDYLRCAASPARAAKFVVRSLRESPPAGLRPFRLALLSSFSIELAHDPIVAHGYTEGLAVEIYNPGYDQYHQQIFAPQSGLYAAEPDAIVLAVEGRRLAPELYEGYLSGGPALDVPAAEEIASRVGEMIATLRRHTSAPLLLHTLDYPRHPALGVLDAGLDLGQRALIAAVNREIAGLAREHGAVYPVDIDALAQSLGHEKWHDGRLEYFARSPIARSAFDPLARHYLRYLRALAGNSRKCVVVDLDNTLWGGIVGEDGPKGIALGSEYPGNAYVAFQRALLALRDRGVILAVASKNNPADVEEAFSANPAMLLRLEDFSAREIHWEPKSASIARIAAQLNIGLRHMVFVDDNPAECAEVAQAHPAVTVIRLPEQPEKMVDELLSEGLFDSLQFSREDAQRADLYRQREQAEKLRTEVSSIEDYYRSLEMEVHLAPVTRDSLARASQMTRKTTQFNTTTRLYGESEIEAFRRDDACRTLTMRVVDKFGDNGIVGLALARRDGDHYDLDTFLMSCRVINRGVETAMLHWLAEQARAEGLAALEGWILPTARNLPVRDLFERHGFSLAETTAEGARWRLELAEGTIGMPDWLRVVETTE